MEHKVEIVFDGKYLARPWGIICRCGYEGCTATKEEAEEVAEHHKQQSGVTEAREGRNG